MKRINLTLTLTILALTIFTGVYAQEDKPQFKFGGVIDAKIYFDTYRSRTSRNDLINSYPLAPNFNTNGVDLNKASSLYFSIFSSKLNFSVTNIKLLGADVNTFIEADFMGSSDAGIQMFNMRHAYFNLKWKRDQLLIGQTNHLTFVDEVAPNTVSFAAGSPYYLFNRGPQIRYSHKFSKDLTFLVSAEYYGLHNTVGPSNSQSLAGIPDFQMQVKLGGTGAIFGGITVGYKFLKPRLVDNSSNPINSRIGSFNVNGFFKVTTNKGYNFKLWGIYGENLTILQYPGGYGKVLTDDRAGDYDYSNLKTFSGWFDFETPSIKNFKLGLFVGYQKNLGSSKELDLAKSPTGNFLYGYYKDADISWFSKISPRLEYSASKKLIFAIEYSLSLSQWAKTYDNYFKAIDLYPTQHNNRLELMARYIF